MMNRNETVPESSEYSELNSGSGAGPRNADNMSLSSDTDSSVDQDEINDSTALMTTVSIEYSDRNDGSQRQNIAEDRNFQELPGCSEEFTAVTTRLISDNVPNIPMERPRETEYNLSNEQYEIDPKNLISMKKLGEGHFGDVFIGLLKLTDGKQVTVAVKQSKMSSATENITKKQRDEMYQQQLSSLRCEIRIMAMTGSHPNILKLIGVVTKSPDDLRIVTEYCEYGSLDQFLRGKKGKDKFVNEYIMVGKDGYQLTKTEFCWKTKEDRNWAAGLDSRRKNGIVTTSDLMWFGLQIAQAMVFLIKQNILHRDIALRNILLANDYVAKVADFGLSRKIKNEIYEPSNRNALPVGYLAPEVLEDKQFSRKSESWAFGIVLWELFTLAEQQPYLKECGSIDGFVISAFLGANKRLPIPEITPLSTRELISQLWSKEPTVRPDFEVCQSVIMEELKIANPELADRAEQMWTLKSDSKSSLANLRVPPVKSDCPTDGEKADNAHKLSSKWISKYRKVPCCFLPLLLSLLIISAFIGIYLWNNNRDHTNHKGFVAGRWSWTFNASDAYNIAHNQTFYRESLLMNLGTGPGCRALKWQLFFGRNQTGTDIFHFPFFLRYINGPQNLKAWRSMLLTTRDGREIMQGNDFHRDGFYYNLNKYDRKTWSADSVYLTNSSVNDPLTLRTEVFVDPAWAGCKYIKETSLQPVNYENECEQLPTETKLFFDGACYVGSNTRTQFSYAIQLCNDIPSAGISRLAWIESTELLNELKNLLGIRDRSKKNMPYYIGAKQFYDTHNTGITMNESWHWIDSNGEKSKPFSQNFSFWSKDQSIEQPDISRQNAALFYNETKIIAVNEDNYYRYLCEYRKADDR